MTQECKNYLWEELLDKKISKAAIFAINNPFYVTEFFVYGFHLMLHWDTQHNWFECILHFSPHSSSYYHYSETKKSLIDKVRKSIKSWGCKGRYLNYKN